MVVNRHPNVARLEYDTLRVILHNCARHGAPGQNRAGHADFEAPADATPEAAGSD
ncbi:MAG: hypothetical protein ACRD12_00035 [Acidimicrobiales bacterium]